MCVYIPQLVQKLTRAEPKTAVDFPTSRGSFGDDGFFLPQPVVLWVLRSQTEMENAWSGHLLPSDFARAHSQSSIINHPHV